MHIYGIQKDGTDEPNCRAAMETQTEKTGLQTQKGKEVEGQIETVTLKRIHCVCVYMQDIIICKIDNHWEFAIRCRELKPGAL